MCKTCGCKPVRINLERELLERSILLADEKKLDIILDLIEQRLKMGPPKKSK